jgi:hypothetical protein
MQLTEGCPQHWSRVTVNIKIFSTWQAVESMTDEQQRRLLFFWTSVKYLPSDGF